MTKVCASGQLPDCTRMWRYLSLDKLIDLLDTGELFFAPLASFIKSDPYEGYLPAVAMEAHAGIFGSTIRNFESTLAQLESMSGATQRETSPEGLANLRWKLNDLKTAPARFFQAINQSITINCWHASECESEAMWRLYGDNGKAVAIETDFNALKRSMESRQTEHLVHIHPVKYLDFFDATLKPAHCVVEGHLTPLLKRVAYKHECEVRAFIGRPLPDVRKGLDMAYWKPSPVRLAVDVTRLVMRVHISPYTSQPFESSVIRICKLFGLPDGTVEPSKLLRGHEELLKTFNY